MNPNPYIMQDTQRAYLDALADMHEASVLFFDATMPDWENREISRENSRFVSEQDVEGGETSDWFGMPR
jgi:hypothetical protein